MAQSVFKIKRISSSDKTIRYTARVDESHPVFAGHFPENPVVPGVCTMNMLKHCLSDMTSREIRYEYIKECKFLSVIIPSEHKLLDVFINVKEDNEMLNIVAEVRAGENKMIKMKAVIR